MAHWQDIGGTLDGMTTDIYSEGLQLPIVKAWRAGVPNDDILSIIRMNVRLPERAMGDLKAQVAAVRTGEKRFLELVRKYGKDALEGAIEAISRSRRSRLRATASRRFRTGPTRRNRSWMTMAWTPAGAFRSA